MSLQSVGFFLFFPIVLILSYTLPQKFRKYLLIFASVLFYLCFGIKYIIVLIFSVLTAYSGGVILKKKNSRALLWIFILLNASPLLILKYLHPFESFIAPMGLSFYTLEAIGYLIDVYRGDSILSFSDLSLYLCFFPTVTSGPLKRSGDFLKDLQRSVPFDYERIRQGLLLMALGYIEKLVLADRLAPMVSYVFDKAAAPMGFEILIGTVGFGIQLYFDFAGYSLIAVGAAKALGFDLQDNFRQPYFATDIKDFWRRWHISLSSWLRDYIYIPLGGSRCSQLRKNLNLLLTFIVSGFWHGVGLNFIFWGFLHGIYQVCGSLFSRLRKKPIKNPKLPIRILKSLFVFILVDYAWLYFRASDLKTGFDMTYRIFTDFGLSSFSFSWFFDNCMNIYQLLLWLICFVIIFIIDIMYEKQIAVTDLILSKKTVFRWFIYIVALGLITVGFLSNVGSDTTAFIYNNF